jgi:hypothetical protein
MNAMRGVVGFKIPTF